MEGIYNIVTLHEKIEDPKDVWFSYKIGKKPLSEWLFQVKLQKFKDEQIISVQHQQFYKLLKFGKNDLATLIR